MYKRYWICYWRHNGFEFPIFIHGTEQEMQEYCKTELGYIPRYSGATDEEIKAGETLRMKFYMASDLH